MRFTTAVLITSIVVAVPWMALGLQHHHRQPTCGSTLTTCIERAYHIEGAHYQVGVRCARGRLWMPCVLAEWSGARAVCYTLGARFDRSGALRMWDARVSDLGHCAALFS